jgi:hypothetical protein
MGQSIAALGIGGNRDDLLLALIHRSAWKGLTSANFAQTEF